MDLQIIKKIKIWILIWSLVGNYSLFAQNQQPATNPNPPVNVQQGPDSFNATVQQITQAASTAVQQGMMGKWQIEKEAMMYMQGLQNKPVSLQQVNSKLFPNCILPQTRVNRFSENGLCKGEVNDPTMHQQAIQMEKHARDIWNTYENNLVVSHSAVTSGPYGLSCIDDEIKKLKNSLLSKKNEFNTIRNRMQATVNEYIKSLEARKKKMKDLQNELEGEDFGSAPPAWNHSKIYMMFPDCKEALSSNDIDSGAAKGLYGIKKEFAGILSPAQKVIEGANDNSLLYSAKNQAKEIIKKMKESDVESVAKSIQNSSFSDGQAAPLKFGLFKEIIKEKTEAFQNKVKRVNDRLSKAQLKIELPAQDADFQRNLNVQVFESKLKNDYYTMCINNQSGKKNNVNIWDQITDRSVSKNIRNSKNTTTNIDIFKKEFQKIYERTDLSWPQKSAMVKNLEGNQEFVLSINEVLEKNSAKKDWRPSELLNTIYQNCENTFNKAPVVVGSKTQNEIVNEIVADLNEIKNDDKNFYNDLENTLIDRVANCTGVDYSSTMTCTKDKLDPKSPSFCLAQSRQCADKIQGCYKQIENKQNEVSAKLKVEVDAFNASYNDLEVKTNQQLGLMGDALKFQQELINATFKGAIQFTSGVPDDLFISFGAPENNGNHLQLIKAGSTSNIQNDIKTKTDKLNNALESTYNNLNAYLEEEKNQIKLNLEKEQKYWEQVKTDCGNADKAYRNKLAKANEKAADDQKKIMSDQFKKRDEFCKRYDVYKSIPSCPNIAALNDAMIATDREFIRGLGQTNLVNKIQQTCGGKIDSFDSNLHGSSKISTDDETTTNTDEPAKTNHEFYKFVASSKCSEEVLLQKTMSALGSRIKQLTYVTGKKVNEVTTAVQEGSVGDIIPEVVKSKLQNLSQNSVKAFVEDYKNKYCNFKKDDEKKKMDQRYSDIANTLDFIIKNTKRKPGNMGENNPSDGQALHIPGCEAIQGNTPRNPQPMDFNSQVNSIMQGAMGTKGQ
ncbi:MAG: hypothetical protein U0T83_10620 [Bacteriovoracaceae bacterium]